MTKNELRCTMPGCKESGTGVQPYKFYMGNHEKPIIVGHLCKTHRQEMTEIVKSKLQA